VYFYYYNVFCNINCNVRFHRIKQNRCTQIVMALLCSGVDLVQGLIMDELATAKHVVFDLKLCVFPRLSHT